MHDHGCNIPFSFKMKLLHCFYMLNLKVTILEVARRYYSIYIYICYIFIQSFMIYNIFYCFHYKTKLVQTSYHRKCYACIRFLISCMQIVNSIFVGNKLFFPQTTPSEIARLSSGGKNLRTFDTFVSAFLPFKSFKINSLVWSEMNILMKVHWTPFFTYIE